MLGKEESNLFSKFFLLRMFLSKLQYLLNALFQNNLNRGKRLKAQQSGRHGRHSGIQ